MIFGRDLLLKNNRYFFFFFDEEFGLAGVEPLLVFGLLLADGLGNEFGKAEGSWIGPRTVAGLLQADWAVRFKQARQSRWAQEDQAVGWAFAWAGSGGQLK